MGAHATNAEDEEPKAGERESARFGDGGNDADRRAVRAVKLLPPPPVAPPTTLFLKFSGVPDRHHRLSVKPCCEGPVGRVLMGALIYTRKDDRRMQKVTSVRGLLQELTGFLQEIAEGIMRGGFFASEVKLYYSFYPPDQASRCGFALAGAGRRCFGRAEIQRVLPCLAALGFVVRLQTGIR